MKNRAGILLITVFVVALVMAAALSQVDKAFADNPIQQVSTGNSNTIGLRSDGTAVAIGYNRWGECNVGTWTAIQQVSAGGDHAVGLKNDGTVVATGTNNYGQCNVGTWTAINQVSAGYAHTVGLKSDGAVIATGAKSWGQCNVDTWTAIQQVSAGDSHTVGLINGGSVIATGWNYYSQCNVGTWTAIQQVSAGWFHTVGLKSDGTVVATGLNNLGQCNVSGWSDIQQVSAGGFHTVGLKSDGTVVATGHNSDGQCDVSGWTDIVQISAGYYHTVGLKSDGTVVAIGRNEYGQCNICFWNPLMTGWHDDIAQVSSGRYHTVLLRNNGAVFAFGDNAEDQCDVSSWTDIVQISAGGLHTVGLKSDGTVVATGWNNDGQCDVSGWSDIQQISAGHVHTVGVKLDQTVAVTGSNLSGQCNVGSWSGISRVSAGYLHTVGLKTDLTVVAIGDNSAGQCNVGSWTAINQVSAGYAHTVGMELDFTAVATGDNSSGQCDVTNFNCIRQILAGYWHTVGVTLDGSVVAIGNQADGQCNVAAWDDMVQVSAGYWHTIGLSDNAVYTTGNNDYGQCDLAYPLSVTYDPIGGGTVTLNPSGGMYFDGTMVTLTGTPSTGCSFVEWAGDIAGEINPATIIMDSSKDVIARFVWTGTYIYVNDDASGSNDGTSWQNAFTDLQDALNVSTSGKEIRVASGTYIPSVPVQSGVPRSAAFQMKDGVAIYGGFPSSGSPTWEDRNPQMNETVLSGDIGTTGIYSDNCYHVVLGQGDGPETIIDGFTINGGYADGAGVPGYGGGMYIESGSPVVSNCAFKGNSAGFGGGIFINSNLSPTIRNTVFYSNFASVHGGGIYEWDDVEAIITNCTFYGNHANQKGGGIAAAATGAIANCIFWDNTATLNNQIDPSTLPVVNHCDVQGGYAGTNNIDSSPMLFNPVNGDFHLQASSPCVDSGSNTYSSGITTDFEGDNRIIDGNAVPGAIVDMGVDEFSTIGPHIFVNENASDGGNGTSWQNAFSDFQSALFTASSGKEIWVASGTYMPSVPVQSGTPRSASFQMIDGVAIYGGFPSSGSPTWEDRNPQMSETVLSGDIGTTGVDNDNCYHVVIGQGDGPETRIDGFTITGGKAEGSGVPGYGGGMYIVSGSPVVSNCAFQENSAVFGGGLFINSGLSPAIRNTVLYSNSASIHGGGIYEWGGVKATITNCTFYGNHADGEGGGLAAAAQTKSVANCIFWANTAVNSGSQIAPNDLTVVDHCNVEGGYAGTNNIDSDPMFVNASNGDFHLQNTSPCIDAGSNTYSSGIIKDFECDARVIDGDATPGAIVDMGVDEYFPTGVMVKIFVALQGDNRPNSAGWQIPLTVGFYNPGSDVMTATPVYSFTATAVAEWILGGTKATVTVGPVIPGNYDITVDSTTTLLNMKRSVGIW